jgi:hypothetical protein
MSSLVRVDLNYALTFAIDRSRPIFEGGSFSKHNPAVIVFLKPHQVTKRNKKEVVFHVGKQKMIHPVRNFPSLQSFSFGVGGSAALVCVPTVSTSLLKYP